MLKANSENLVLQVAQRARGASVVVCAGGRQGPEATIWLPGADTPPYLNGELPGDFGFGAALLERLPRHLLEVHSAFREASTHLPPKKYRTGGCLSDAARVTFACLNIPHMQTGGRSCSAVLTAVSYVRRPAGAGHGPRAPQVGESGSLLGTSLIDSSQVRSSVLRCSSHRLRLSQAVSLCHNDT